MNFRNLLKNRTVLGLICIGLSLLICFGITPLFNSALKSQTEIIRVTKNIRKGDPVTKDNTQKIKVGAYNLPHNILKDTSELTNKFAAADLAVGDYVLTSKLTDKPYEENEYLYKLDGTKKAISVSIKNFALGLSGKLKSGDIVSIIASDYGDMRETFIPPPLQYVEVLAVTTSKGTDENLQATDQKAQEKQLPSTVTLLANTFQAKTLAELESKSKIHIALVYRGDESTSKKFLKAQDDINKNDLSERTYSEQKVPALNPTPTPFKTQTIQPVQGGKKNAQ
ncbi:MAG: RcpC/CpaB family pilus assembly protein [Clostridia bacterium]|nr:RcpC/CpaB family pilus assembly protein [Clostridia bacterium]